MLSTRAETCVVLKYYFEACFSNRHDLNTELNNLSAKVLSLHFVSRKKMNSVVFNLCILKMFIIEHYFEIIE